MFWTKPKEVKNNMEEEQTQPKPKTKKISYDVSGEILSRFNTLQEKMGLNQGSIGKIALIEYLDRKLK